MQIVSLILSWMWHLRVVLLSDKQLYDYKRGKAIVSDNGTLLGLTNTILETERDSLAKKGTDMRAKASREIDAEKKAQYEEISSAAGRRGEALEMMNSRYM